MERDKIKLNLYLYLSSYNKQKEEGQFWMSAISGNQQNFPYEPPIENRAINNEDLDCSVMIGGADDSMFVSETATQASQKGRQKYVEKKVLKKKEKWAEKQASNPQNKGQGFVYVFYDEPPYPYQYYEYNNNSNDHGIRNGYMERVQSTARVPQNHNQNHNSRYMEKPMGYHGKRQYEERQDRNLQPRQHQYRKREEFRGGQRSQRRGNWQDRAYYGNRTQRYQEKQPFVRIAVQSESSQAQMQIDNGNAQQQVLTHLPKCQQKLQPPSEHSEERQKIELYQEEMQEKQQKQEEKGQDQEKSDQLLQEQQRQMEQQPKEIISSDRLECLHSLSILLDAVSSFVRAQTVKPVEPQTIQASQQQNQVKHPVEEPEKQEEVVAKQSTSPQIAPYLGPIVEEELFYPKHWAGMEELDCQEQPKEPSQPRKRRNYNYNDGESTNYNREIVCQVQRELQSRKGQSSTQPQSQANKSPKTSKLNEWSPDKFSIIEELNRPQRSQKKQKQLKKIHKVREIDELPAPEPTLPSKSLETVFKKIKSKQKQVSESIIIQPLPQISQPLPLSAPKLYNIYPQLTVQQIDQIIIHSLVFQSKKIKTKSYENAPDSPLALHKRKYKIRPQEDKIIGWLLCQVRGEGELKLKTVSARCRACGERCQGELVYQDFMRKCSCDRILCFHLERIRREETTQTL